MAVPCNAGSVVGHYCPSQSRTQLYSGARTDALDPNEGARHQKEIRGINGQVRSAPARPNAGNAVSQSNSILSGSRFRLSLNLSVQT